MIKLQLVAIGALALIAVPGTAASVVDNYASDAIGSARLTDAVAMLEPRVAAVPTDESALINLAVAYRRMGRQAEAEALYQRVLALDDVMLDAAMAVRSAPTTSRTVHSPVRRWRHADHSLGSVTPRCPMYLPARSA